MKAATGLCLAPVMALAMACSSMAQETGTKTLSLKERNLEIRLGAANITFVEGLKVKIAGTPMPGAYMNADTNYTMVTEIAGFITPNWSVSMVSGVPPTTDIWGRGSLKSLGKLTKVTYGPMVLALRHHFYLENGMSPYIAGGLVYAVMFKTVDSHYLKKVDIDNHFGSAIAAGIDIPITDKLGAFFEVKKMFLSTKGRFDLVTPTGRAPGKADIRLNPLITTVGLSWRF